MTALRKDGGGVRGIVAGEVIRRVTARTIAQQLGPAVEVSTAPFQYALSTRAGCECIVHVLQTLTELNPEATVTSIDGISAYDSISRKAMVEGLARVPGGSAVLPFVHLFYAQPSVYFWEDDCGRVHTIHQGEGGEQGDPLMPLLFSLGQHPALEAVQRQCPDHTVMAFLDDIYLVSKTQEVREGYVSVERELWRHAKIRVHEGKTHIWNLAGIKPEICDVLQRAAEAAKPGARVWRGSEVPTEEQGIKVLGAPVGHRDFVRKHLERILEQHEVLLNGIPRVPDVQSAWLLLLHCASARANYQLRVMRPECVLEFARAHDENMWRGLCTILEVPTTACSRNARDLSSLPLSLGGLGLRSATRTRVSACWASWADTLPMVQSRHPQIADIMVYQLEGVTESPCMGAASSAAAELDELDDLVVPRWSELAAGSRPPSREPEHHEPGAPRHGWQHEAAVCVERRYRDDSLFSRMTALEKAMVRSPAGPNAGVALSTCPCSPLSRIESPLFRVLLQRRLSLPLPLSNRICRCGLPNDQFGHHRAACSRTGLLGRRGFPLESAAARICREAGGRVATNMFVRNMDLGAPNAADNRRLEVVVDGLPLFGGVQLAVDTTLVSAVQGDGVPRRGAANRDGVALASARWKKARTYPELVATGARARLVVLALEVGGRW